MDGGGTVAAGVGLVGGVDATALVLVVVDATALVLDATALVLVVVVSLTGAAPSGVVVVVGFVEGTGGNAFNSRSIFLHREAEHAADAATLRTNSVPACRAVLSTSVFKT